MSKKNFKIRVRIINGLIPHNLPIETVNEYINRAYNDKDCLKKAIIIIDEAIKAVQSEVKAAKVKEIMIHQLKEIPVTKIEGEAAFWWMIGNKYLPEYDSAKILSFFDGYVKRYRNSNPDSNIK